MAQLVATFAIACLAPEWRQRQPKGPVATVLTLTTTTIGSSGKARATSSRDSPAGVADAWRVAVADCRLVHGGVTAAVRRSTLAPL